MGNSYWRDNKLIQAIKEEKDEHLNYEIEMFRETCKQLNFPQQRFEMNLLLESLSAHTRTLIEFFYDDKDEKYPNDLVAQDLLPNTINWKTERPQITELLKEARNKADKQVAHLSLWRIKIERDNKKAWNWNDVSKDMEKVVKKFEDLR
ncbi:MAG: hypothetical protein WCV68_00070 [Candidatus Paceibacterota bacterium]|jgi:hypothetical protein